jgi:hypothetical protein
MAKCQNPECSKDAPKGKKYCDESCLTRALELKEKAEDDKEDGKYLKKTWEETFPILHAEKIMESFNMEIETLKQNPNCHLELFLTRGPPIKGTFMALDPRYAKIAVQEDGSNKELTIVKLGYVACMRIRTEEKGASPNGKG